MPLFRNPHRRAGLLVLAIAVLAVALRWYYVTVSMVIHPIRGDAVGYYACAWNLVHHATFSMAAPHSAVVTPDSYRDPGFPLLLAFWLKLLGDHGQGWYAGILLTQALLGGLTVLLVMLLARRVLSLPWVAAVGVLAAIWPHTLTLAGDLLTETLFGFLCALSLWLLVVAAEKRSWRWMAAAGLALGCGSLTNAILTPFFLLLAAWLGWQTPRLRRLLPALLIAGALLPGVWQLRNLTLPPQESAQSRALINLVQGSWPSYHSSYRAAVFHSNPAAEADLRALSAAQNQMLADPAAGFAAMGKRFAAQPLRFLVWYAWHKPIELWAWSIRMGQGDIYEYAVVHSPYAFNSAWRLMAAVCYALDAPLGVLMLIGGIILLRRRPTQIQDDAARLAGASVALLLLWATFVYTVFQSEPRYSTPFRGFEMLAAMAGLAAVARGVSWLRTRANARPTPNA